MVPSPYLDPNASDPAHNIRLAPVALKAATLCSTSLLPALLVNVA